MASHASAQQAEAEQPKPGAPAKTSAAPQDEAPGKAEAAPKALPAPAAPEKPPSGDAHASDATPPEAEAEAEADAPGANTEKSAPPEKPEVPAAAHETEDDAKREEPESKDAEGEVAQAPASDDPYEGLDHSGTPPLPPEDAEEIPDGEWDGKYDGRRKKKRAEDALIWIPRAPLLPAHIILNYGVRWPIVTGVAKAEEVRLFHRIEDLFTFADGQAGLYPIGFYDVGRGLWGGGQFFYNDLGVEGHSVRATAGYGSNNWIMATATDSWKVFDGETGTLSFTGTYVHDPTFAFTGIGPDTDIDDQSFFTEEKVEGKVNLDVALQGLSRFSWGVSFKRAQLKGDGREPSFDDSIFAPAADGLTGFDEWFNLLSTDMRLELDSRDPDRQYTSGSGVRLETWGSYHVGIGEPELSFFRYGTRPGVLWDFTGANHVLSLSVHTEALSKTGGEAPPLNELVSLGGSELMKGFLPGRLRGESALVYSAAYSWPVLAYADALIFSDLGTTYQGFYDDFSHDRMVLDWGTGIRTSFSRDLRVEVLVAWATNQMEQWNDEFNIDQVRFIAGVGRGF